MAENYFQKLFDVNVSDKIEKKNGLSYVSWPYAWAEIKKLFPDATYTVYERQTEYGLVNYFTDGRTCWVKTGMTVNGIEHIEMLPVMDFKNNSIPLTAVKSTDVNKAIQRSLTKAAARHGLGLYVYAGEDLPESEKKLPDAPQEKDESKAEKLPDMPKEKVSPKAETTTSELVPPPNPVKTYIANELTFMKQMFNERDTRAMIDRFTQMRKELIEKKIIPDVAPDKQTMEQARAMVKAIYDNFSPSGEMKDARTA